MSSEYTDLIISGVGLPDYALRGVRQTVSLIDQASRLERTVNGKLVDIGDPAFRKYRTTISGQDQEAPALGDVWPGRLVTVTSVVSWASSGTGATGGATGPTGGGTPTGATGVGFTGLVKSFDVEVDEWAASVSWTMEIEQL
jgi:hypothetical protein